MMTFSPAHQSLLLHLIAKQLPLATHSRVQGKPCPTSHAQVTPIVTHHCKLKDKSLVQQVKEYIRKKLIDARNLKIGDITCICKYILYTHIKLNCGSKFGWNCNIYSAFSLESELLRIRATITYSSIYFLKYICYKLQILYPNIKITDKTICWFYGYFCGYR